MSVFLKIWWVSLFLKILIAYFLPFFSDESYYWVWSHHLQLSYFDHPPFIAWLLSLGKPLEGLGHLARFPILVMSHLTLLIWKTILNRYLTERQLTLWLAFALLNPLFGLGGLIATPDVPLMFFWSASIMFFQKYIDMPNRRNAALLGAMLGLGFCSKYHIVLFPIAILIWTTLYKKWSVIRWKHIALCIYVGLIFCLPVLIWNAFNNFDSFVFQLSHGLVRKNQHMTYPLEYLGGQFLLLFPTVAIAATALSVKRSHELKVWAWLPLIFFFITSFKSRVEPNWPIMAYPAMLALACLAFQRTLWPRVTLSIWALSFLVAFGCLVTESPQILFHKTKLRELNAHKVLKDVPHKYTPLYAGSYQLASALSYLTKVQVYKLNGMNRRDFYDYLDESKPESDIFYVVMKNDQTLPNWVKDHDYKVVDEIDQYQVFEVDPR